MVPESQGTGDWGAQGWPRDRELGCSGDWGAQGTPTAPPYPAGGAGHLGPASSSYLMAEFTSFPGSKQIHEGFVLIM